MNQRCNKLTSKSGRWMLACLNLIPPLHDVKKKKKWLPLLKAYYVPGNGTRYCTHIASAQSLSFTEFLHLGVMIPILQAGNKSECRLLTSTRGIGGSRAKFSSRHSLSTPHRPSEWSPLWGFDAQLRLFSSPTPYNFVLQVKGNSYQVKWKVGKHEPQVPEHLVLPSF